MKKIIEFIKPNFWNLVPFVILIFTLLYVNLTKSGDIPRSGFPFITTTGHYNNVNTNYFAIIGNLIIYYIVSCLLGILLRKISIKLLGNPAVPSEKPTVKSVSCFWLLLWY